MVIDRRRLPFWALLAVFVVLSLWWLAHFPFSRARVYRAIPTNASLITRHEHLDRRWRGWVGHPLLTNLLVRSGVKAEALRELVRDEAVDDWLGRVAGRDTLLAYVPALGVLGEPAWVLSSWIGSYSQFLRWGMLGDAMEDFERVRLGPGRFLWTQDAGDFAPGRHLSVAVVEGVLVAALSRDRQAARVLMYRIERHSPMAPDLAAHADFKARGGNLRSAPDRAWLRWQGGAGRRGGERSLGLLLRAGDDGALRGRLQGDAGLPRALTGALAAEDIERPDAVSLARLLGDAPDLVASLPLEAVRPILLWCGAGAVADAADPLLRQAAGDSVFVGLGGDELSGRVLGLKVPSVLVGIRVRAPAAAWDSIPEAVDRLNAATRWGVLPRRSEAAGRPAIVFDAARAGLYGSLKGDDKLCCAAYDDWLVFASSLSALERLGADNGGSNGTPRWRAALAADDASARLWLDLTATTRAASGILSVSSLVLSVRDPAGSAALRRQLRDARGWLDFLGAAETASVWVLPGEQPVDLEFELTAPQPSS